MIEKKKYKEKINNWWFTVWEEYNEEGMRGKDAFFMVLFIVGMFLTLTNLMLWMIKPEQEWIGKILYPMM